MKKDLRIFIIRSSILSKVSILLLTIFTVFLSIDSGVLGNIIFANPLNLDENSKEICGLVKDYTSNRVELNFTKINSLQSTRPVFIKFKPENIKSIQRYEWICFDTQGDFKKFQRFATVLDLTNQDILIEISNEEMAEFIEDFSNYINESLDKYFGEDSGLVKALVFGIKDDLLSEDKKTFQDIGASHLLVASGANIVIILSVIKRFTQKLKYFTKSSFLSLIIEVLAIFTYLLIVGLEGSLVRAVVFWLFLNIEMLVGRKVPFILKTEYCIAIITILLPENLFSLSFYLSIGALIGINLGNDLVKFLKLSGANEIIKLCIINFAILIVTGIITSYFFAQLNFTGLISNLILLPLAEFIVGVGFGLSIAIFVVGNLNIIILNELLFFLSTLLSMLVGLLREISKFIQEIGLSTFLNSKFYINTQTLFLLIFAISVIWFYIKFINFLRIRESLENI